MLGKLSARQIEQVLREATVGRIGATVDGMTYVVPITFVRDGDFVYGHSLVGQKVRMMRRNPRVCFQVDEIRDMRNWRCVIAQGQFEELTGDLAAAAARLIEARLGPLATSQTAGPRPRRGSERGSVSYRIRLDLLSGRYERSAGQRRRRAAAARTRSTAQGA